VKKINFVKYSDQLANWLMELGYTHYFYVGGGNIMHLTESLSKHLVAVPVVHEVAAGIAAEYFNEISENGRALALVTTGPGITNAVTAIAGAWLESRELLVIGGQVKTIDLATNGLRARGIQEVNGVDLLKPTTKISRQIKEPIDAKDLRLVASASWTPRKGPVFLEIPLDVQAAKVEQQAMIKSDFELTLPCISVDDLENIVVRFNQSRKPILLIGGGVSYALAMKLQLRLLELQIPVMTTYNGADRIDGSAAYYLGRPNTWGQRSSNIIIQQSDLIIAVGTRLGMQQTGFNWQEFGRDAHIVQIEIDPAELSKGHPRVDQGICVDADDFLKRFVSHKLTNHDRWLKYAHKIRSNIPRVENVNQTKQGYLSPYEFITTLENLTDESDLIIPCSSGSAFTLSMQLYKQKLGQRILTNKSLASMGYGLSGAIGACLGGDNKRRTILIEGDGGFAQNMQEVGTAEINDLNLKMFIFHDQGHASIRMTQKSYFKGKYLGCDRKSGLGLPKWTALFNAWDVPVIEVNQEYEKDPLFLKHFNEPGLCAFIVQIDPDQTYFPKISSRVTHTGSMESNPIDQMTPEIDYIKGIDF
jgi:acetolactate synthase I/II/III large subunit